MKQPEREESGSARVMIRIPLTLKKKCEEKAKRENRTLSNWILHVLSTYEKPTQIFSA
jgi:hypothetical protein